MIKFGPSGNSVSFYAEGYTHTEEAAKYVKERGLDCFEYSFGRGVRMSEEKALSLRRAFEAQGVEISVHAPYFINFANPSDEMAAKSYEYVLQSANMARLMGAKRVVFHPAAQGKAERAEAVALTKERLKILRDYIYMNGLQQMKFCPETMGKIAQIGTVEEIAEFCGIDEIFTPCVDFGHVNAREGGSLKTEDDYLSLLNFLIDRLGIERMRDFHVHFSKIMYSAKGEVKHLTFADETYGPEFAPLAAALKKTGLQPYIVCESDGTQAEDAAEMKKIYDRAL
ncbi:MAG: TIM barrel protein [Candidatus Borkfalkiaceae bacterium]|nr:TIM barrel protein [Clostridia bacterium]MDY6223189.1 TIM barrel protein [Christensenellaceae bacterium]